MKNIEVLAIIKATNKLVDELKGLSVDSQEYKDINEMIYMNLVGITFDCPRWKYYQAWTLHCSPKTGYYWVTFAK